MLTKRMSAEEIGEALQAAALTRKVEEEIGEALQAAALTRKVEGVTGGVKMTANGAKGDGVIARVEVEPLDFDATETADACKAWLLAAPRRLVAMGEIKFSQVDGEWVGDVNVEPKARKPRAAKV